jgi:predicted nucleic acid-binding protein
MTPEPARYLIDNSVWARLTTHPEVVAALKGKLDLIRPGNALICAPTALEIGFSARSATDHSALMGYLEAFPGCSIHPDTADALQIQNALWSNGLLRAAGAMDTLIAAYAIKNNATVLHYDRDFDHIATVVTNFRHEWIVTRGSL